MNDQSIPDVTMQEASHAVHELEQECRKLREQLELAKRGLSQMATVVLLRDAKTAGVRVKFEKLLTDFDKVRWGWDGDCGFGDTLNKAADEIRELIK